MGLSSIHTAVALCWGVTVAWRTDVFVCVARKEVVPGRIVRVDLDVVGDEGKAPIVLYGCYMPQRADASDVIC